MSDRPPPPAAVQTVAGRITVPAPTLRDDSGVLDVAATARYARRVASSWIQHVIVSGPMGLGEDADSDEREQLLDLWVRECGPSRLVAACWTGRDVEVAQQRGVQPLVMLAAKSERDMATQLDAAAGAWVYANPRYSMVALAPAVAAAAQVAGVKMSKVTAADLTAMRAACPDAVIVHGSGRDIAASITAGADMVTVAPLAALVADLPDPALGPVQDRADAVQSVLDDCGSHRGRVDWITGQARAVADRT